MALSTKERKRRRKVIGKIVKEEVQEVSHPINEAEGKIQDLTELERVINHREYHIPKLKFSSGVDELFKHDVTVSLLFFKNKINDKVDDGECFVFSYDFKRDDDKYTGTNGFTYLQKVSPVDFNKAVTKIDSTNATVTVEDIVSLCDASVIYYRYEKKALDILRKYDNISYHMFKGANLIHKEDFNVSTLCVGMHNKLKKFIYRYNPKFILAEALEEYQARPEEFETLEDCYVMLLAFFINHEMLHLVANNVTSFGLNSDVHLDSGSNRIDNVVQDGYINSRLAITLAKTGLCKSKWFFPRNCVSDIVNLRCQHNVGLKAFRDTNELNKLIKDKLIDVSGITCKMSVLRGDKISMSKFTGADFMCNIFIAPSSLQFRKNSHVYQKLVNDLVRIMSDGQIYWSMNGGITSEEKVSDKDILPEGTLVRIKLTKTIGMVTGYYEYAINTYITTQMYKISSVEQKKIDEEPAGDGFTKYKPRLVKGKKELGEYERRMLVPITEDDLSWVEGKKEEKNKLTEEDKQSSNNASNMGSGGSGGERQPKVINVGDIVWISRKRMFGRVISISNGQFQIEGMKEEPCVVVDDYKGEG
jgi:hypothetical protein